MIWLLNFLFDSLLLFVTGLVLKRTFKKRMLFAGGLIGSLVVFLPFIPFDSFMTSPVMKILISLLMVWVAFGYKRLRYFLTNMFVFYFITFSIGGALIGLNYLFMFDYDIGSTLFLSYIRGFGDPISWLFVVIGFPLVWYFSKGIFDKWENVQIQYDQLIQVEIFMNQKSVQLKGLVDSGNQLYDPLTKRPVMIVSLQKTSHFFPNELLQIVSNIDHLWNEKTDFSDEWASRISVIPFQVVGAKNKLMVCVKPDKVIFRREDDQFETEQLLIAFVDQQLSSDDAFDAIVHPKLVTHFKSKQVS